MGYLLPNLSDYPISPENWRRVGDSNSYAPKLRRFSGPVGHHLPVPSVWWLILVAGYRVERSLRLFRPTLSPDQIQPALSKNLEARRRIELRVNRFAGGAVTVSLRAWYPRRASNPHAEALVPKTSVSTYSTTRAKLLKFGINN